MKKPGSDFYFLSPSKQFMHPLPSTIDKFSWTERTQDFFSMPERRMAFLRTHLQFKADFGGRGSCTPAASGGLSLAGD